MGNRAIEGNVVTGIGYGAPTGVGPERETIAAIVVGRAASRHTRAAALGRAPREASVTKTVSAAVVAERAKGGDLHALVGRGTPAPADLEGYALSAAIGGVAAKGHGNTGALGRAPRLAGGADALSTVVMVVGTLGGNHGALAQRGAPGRAGSKGSVLATVVVLEETGLHEDTGVGRGAPGKADIADAVAAGVVIVRTLNGNLGALVGQLAPGVTGDESDAAAAVVIGEAASRNGYTSALKGAPSLTRGTHADAAVVVVVGTLSRNLLAGLGDGAP